VGGAYQKLPGLSRRHLLQAQRVHELHLLARQNFSHAFPAPENLARLDTEALRPLGLSRQKARAIIELASAISEKRLNLDGLENLDNEAASDRLRKLRGVGRWSAEYVLLRGLGRLHVFPGDDVGARNRLQHRLDLAGPLDYEGVRYFIAPWRTYGGFIYFHLLLKGLTEAGFLNVKGERLSDD